LIVVAVGALSQERLDPTLESQPVPDTGQAPGAEQSQPTAGQQESDADRLVPALKAIESAIRDQIAEEDAQQRERQDNRDIADLEAQQDMALWAKAMFWAAFASTWLTFAGICLIGWTLYYTKIAAKAAVDAATEARRTTGAAVEST
jgi:hypothetical protein